MGSQPDDDDNDPEAEELDSDEQKSDMKARNNLLKLCAEIVEDKFIWVNNSRDRSLVQSDEVPKLKIKPDFKDSWFDTPDSDTATDTIGVWPPATNFPQVGRNQVPEAYKKKIPLPLAAKAESKFLEDFLHAGRMDSNNQINLNTLVFDKSQYKLPKSHLGPINDAFIREQLLDNLITDEVLELTDTLLGLTLDEVANNSSGLSAKDLLDNTVSNLNYVRKVNTLGSQCNLRGRHSTLALYTKNKIALREEVLQDFSGPDHTKNILKGTSLFHKELFGPLPESFRDSVLNKGGQNLSLRFVGKKPAVPISSASKRPAPKQGGVPAKSQRVGPSPGFRLPSAPLSQQQYQDSYRPQTTAVRGRWDNKTPKGRGRKP